MARLVFSAGQQKLFLNEVADKLKLSADALGELVGISGRSFRDWMREKTIGTEKGLMKLSDLSGIKLPEVVEVREEFWSGRVFGSRAAKIRLKLYGPPGTTAGRARGGKVSQMRRKENPEYYRTLECKVENEFKSPSHSEELAEFVGVLLGDGCLTKRQCGISVSLKVDKPYSKYLRRMIYGLFGRKPSMLVYERWSVIVLLVTGVKFVKLLEGFGLKIGNKVANQVDIPDWIKANRDYYRSCVRGLFDTDGGSYFHVHSTGGYRYRHFGITFTSASEPLLDSFYKGVLVEGIGARLTGQNVMVYNMVGVRKFFDVFEPRNEKHRRRLEKHLNSPTRLD